MRREEGAQGCGCRDGGGAAAPCPPSSRDRLRSARVGTAAAAPRLPASRILSALLTLAQQTCTGPTLAASAALDGTLYCCVKGMMTIWACSGRSTAHGGQG
jgi:hypothetical protein